MGGRKCVLTIVAFLFLIWGAGCGLSTAPEFPTAQPSPTPTIKSTAIPSPTPEPTVVPSPTQSPSISPTRVPFPPRPEQFADHADAVIGYLNESQGDVDGLREMLEEWRSLRHVTELLRVDVDDDGAGELLLIIVDHGAEFSSNLPGDLLVIDVDEQAYRLAYSASGNLVITEPSLLEVGDLNHDGYTEVAFTSTSCGAHTCHTTVYVIASGAGTYDDLTQGGTEMPSAEVYFSDWDRDGVEDLVMYGGTIGSVGAGPQRPRTVIYRWDGVTYVLSQTIHDPSNYLYFKVLDANEALLAGEHGMAADLYRQAIENPDLQIWMEQSERKELIAFASYRLTLTHLLLGDLLRAEEARDRLWTQQPDNIYTEVAGVLWDTYLKNGDLRVACQAVTVFAAAHPETADVLANYGYANPSFTPEQVCPDKLYWIGLQSNLERPGSPPLVGRLRSRRGSRPLYRQAQEPSPGVVALRSPLPYRPETGHL